MQKLKFVSSIVLAFVLAVRGNAQDSERRYWSVEVVEVKPNKSDSFEALMKEIAAAMADQKYAYSYFVCKSSENKYFTIKQMLNLPDAESMESATKNAWQQIDKRLTKKYAKYVKKTVSYIIKDLLEHSYIPANPRLLWNDVVYARWEFHTVEPNLVDAYLQQMSHFQDLKRTANYDDPAFLLTGVSGFDEPTFILLQYGKDEADRAQEDERLWSVTGEDGKQAFEDVVFLVKEQKYIPFWILRDLSYDAMLKTENL